MRNKLKAKKGTLPDDVTYIAGEHVPDAWNCYPWDAKAYGRDIHAHEALARQCSGEEPAIGSDRKRKPEADEAVTESLATEEKKRCRETPECA